MKECFKCHEVLPLSEFYPHPRMADGHLNKCKDCAKADAKNRYERFVATPEGLEAERTRGREKYWRLYEGIKRPAKTRNNRGWIERNPEKRAAHNAVAYALRTGELQKQPCEVCGATNVQGHHDDYDKPLKVRWLCPRHHSEHHRLERAG